LEIDLRVSCRFLVDFSRQPDRARRRNTTRGYPAQVIMHRRVTWQESLAGAHKVSIGKRWQGDKSGQLMLTRLSATFFAKSGNCPEKSTDDLFLAHRLAAMPGAP
jgi:hypothetical protein